MSKRKVFLNRLDDLFSEDVAPPDPLETTPKQKEETHPEGSREQPEALLTRPSLAPDEKPHNELKSMGQFTTAHLEGAWAEYLNAIDRPEQMTFSYDLSGSSPAGQYDDDSSSNGGKPRLSVPLVVGNECIGTIELEGDPENPWSEQEAGLVSSVLQQMAQHLENLRLLSQAEKYREEAELAVRRLTREGWESFLESRATSISGYVYDANRVVPVETDSLPSVATSNCIAHPITVRKETIGELVIEAPRTDTAADLLKAVAERLGVHIENLRLLEETERARRQLDRRAAELETVAKVSTAAATILDPVTLLRTVVELTKYSFKLYHAHVYEFHELTGELVLAAGVGKIGDTMLAERHSIALGDAHSVVAKVARTRNGMILSDTRSDPHYPYHPLLPDVRSELAVPMIVGDQVLGVFSVLSDIPNRFQEDDMRTFSTLASQTAVALRNAQLYAEQMRTVERLRELDQLKTSFLANMSHELRTPLNSILGFTDVMLMGLDGPLTDLMINDLGLIQKNGRHLLSLINDILDMAKIEAGKMNLSFERFKLEDVIKEALDVASPLAREKGLSLDFDPGNSEGLELVADAVRMRQVLINILGNAIKFTETGGVTISVEKRQEVVRIEIADTGIGIPENKLEMIFEAFSQVDTSTTRKAGGTGLGLPISRRLIELQGGKLWAESSGVPGEGSRFIIEMPVEVKAE
jgi:signal transduction histidine kinase